MIDSLPQFPRKLIPIFRASILGLILADIMGFKLVSPCKGFAPIPILVSKVSHPLFTMTTSPKQRPFSFLQGKALSEW